MIQAALYIPCAIILQFFPTKYIQYSEENSERLGETVDIISITQNKKLLKRIYQLLSNKIYVFTIISISACYFVVTGVQFWATDYLLNVLNVKGPTVFTAYATTVLTAPTLGVAGGGYIIHKSGGYENKRAI